MLSDIEFHTLVAGLNGNIGRSNCFVGLLRGSLAFIEVGFFGKIFRTVAVAHKCTAFIQRGLGNVERVGTHVGDEPAFIEFLRNAHRARRRVAESTGSRLLKRAGDERWPRTTRNLLGDHIADFQCAAVQFLLDAFELLLRLDRPGQQLAILDTDRLAVDARQLNGKRVEWSLLLADFRADREIGFRFKVHDLIFALADEAQRHGLHAADTLRAADLLAHHRTALEANQPVEDATRLLCIHPIHINLFRIIESREDRGFGDFVVRHAVEVFLRHVFLEHLEQVPCNRFPLTVGVGGKVYVFALLGFRLKLLQHLLTARCCNVFRLEVLFDIHAQLLGRQVAHMADRGQYGVVLAEELVDFLRLCRRLHYH